MKRVAVIFLIGISLMLGGCKVQTHVTSFDGHTVTTTRENGVTTTTVTDKDGNIISQQSDAPQTFGGSEQQSSGSSNVSGESSVNSGQSSIMDSSGSYDTSSSFGDNSSTSSAVYFDASAIQDKSYPESRPNPEPTMDELQSILDVVNNSQVQSPLGAYQAVYNNFGDKYTEAESVYIVNNYMQFNFEETLATIMYAMYSTGDLDIFNEDARTSFAQDCVDKDYSIEQVDEAYNMVITYLG